MMPRIASFGSVVVVVLSAGALSCAHEADVGNGIDTLRNAPWLPHVEPCAEQAQVDRLARFLSQECPRPLFFEDGVRNPEALDIDDVFGILTHLRMEDRYRLDYVYYSDMCGDYPIVYARRCDERPFASAEAFAESVGQPLWGSAGAPCALEMGSAGSAFLDHVRTDETPEGYLELIFLRMMAPQFYLGWHANYYDHTIVCDATGLRGLSPIALLDQSADREILATIQEAAQLHLAPKVTVEQDTVRIRCVVFSDWSGFSYITHEVRRRFPHTVVTIEKEALIPYSCGRIF